MKTTYYKPRYAKAEREERKEFLCETATAIAIILWCFAGFVCFMIFGK